MLLFYISFVLAFIYLVCVCVLYQQVLWFDVSVDDVHSVQVLDGSGQVEHHGAGITLAVLCGGGDGIKQVTALKQTEALKQ